MKPGITRDVVVTIGGAIGILLVAGLFAIGLVFWPLGIFVAPVVVCGGVFFAGAWFYNGIRTTLSDHRPARVAAPSRAPDWAGIEAKFAASRDKPGA